LHWLVFVASSAVVVGAAYKLAEYGDVIAVRTRLSGLLIGTILLAGATSLPELLTSISAYARGEPDLAAGSFFGSNMVNVLMLAVVDTATTRVPLMRRTAVGHALTATLASLLMIVAAIFILADFDRAIGWIGIDSLVLVALYFAGIRLISRVGGGGPTTGAPEVVPADTFPTLRHGLVGFGACAGLLALVVPHLVGASTEIAKETGLGTSFVGTALLSIVTSLPELLAAIAAVRIGAFDMAVGNLFGSSVFNMLALGVSDAFYFPGRLFDAIDPGFALVALLGLLLTNMALLGNLARVERRVLFVEADALAVILVYVAGMYLLFVRGLAF
jgi:cation:H+ antiporter